MRKQNLSYFKFAQMTQMGMQTAKELYENPYYQMNITTLYKCCKFFNLQPGDLLQMEPEKNYVA